MVARLPAMAWRWAAALRGAATALGRCKEGERGERGALRGLGQMANASASVKGNRN
jgi:hypothetical protein